MLNKPKFITANWNVPKNVKTLITTRVGGYSHAPFDSFNLALHVGDKVNTVNHNRQILREYLPHEPHWLEQTHSDHILCIDTPITKNMQSYDASYTQQKNQVCVIMTADCLPILITDRAGSTVAAIHAGWRGLANNIITKTLAKLKLPPQSIIAYIGPSICGEHYEVDQDVYDIFNNTNDYYKINPHFSAKSNGKYMLNLGTMAKEQLIHSGVGHEQIYLSGICTYCESNLFYSYRQQGITGRIATLIWRE